MARTDQPPVATDETQPVAADGSQAPAADGTQPLEAGLRQRSGDRESLLQGLKRLQAGHPSSLAAENSGEDLQPAEPSAEDADWRSPADDAERARMIGEKLESARREGLATDERYLDDRGIWSPERQDAHDAIVRDLYDATAGVPCERQAIMAGGLGGAGKSTVLDSYAGIDRSRYLRINPDDIKEEMAQRGLVPDVAGLSPMEASDLVHEESSAVAKMLARRAMADGKNIIWDITMSSTDSVSSRLDVLDSKGYSTRGIFVDIPVDVAVERSGARHRIGHADYLAGNGLGGRYVPPELIRAHADEDWGSVNRSVFEQVKPRFIEWAVYDNSVTGREPQLVEASAGWNPEEER